MRRVQGTLIFTVLGSLYLLLSVLAIFNAFYYGRPHDVFWSCYLGMFLIGVGLLAHERTLVQSQLYILFIPDLIWSLDFMTHLISGTSVFGLVDYFFNPGPISARLVSLQHLTTVPLGVYFFYKWGITRAPVWVLSWFQLLLLYVFIRFLTPASVNVNCAYRLCGAAMSTSLYPLWWIVGTLGMVYVTHRVICMLPGVKQREHRR